MEWIATTIKIEEQAMDALMGRLVMAGIESFEIKDPEEIKSLLKSSIYWDYIDEDAMKSLEDFAVVVYLPDNDQGNEQLETLSSIVADFKKEGNKAEVSKTTLKEEDWANNWKQYFKPLKIGNKMIIKPSWETLSDEEAQGKTVVEIDPSMSFGTGGHATTRLCLMELENAVNPGMKVLDMGCGSGILLTAALLLGAEFVTGVDIEENAVITTKENTDRNKIAEDRYRLFLGNVLEDEALVEKIGGGNDLIVANIVADVIIAMTGLFKRLLKPEGSLIVSGIILERLEEVKEALVKGGFVIEHIQIDGEWAEMLLTPGK